MSKHYRSVLITEERKRGRWERGRVWERRVIRWELGRKVVTTRIRIKRGMVNVGLHGKSTKGECSHSDFAEGVVWYYEIEAWGYFVQEHAKGSIGLVYLRKVSLERNHISIPLDRRLFYQKRTRKPYFLAIWVSCGVYFENCLLDFVRKSTTITFNTPSASEYKRARRDVFSRDVNLFCDESVLLEILFKLFTSELLVFLAIASLSPDRSAFEMLG